jgi:hypothetical protein
MTPLIIGTILSVIGALAVVLRDIQREGLSRALLASMFVTAGLTIILTSNDGQSPLIGSVMASGVYADGSQVETILELPAVNGGRSVRGLVLKTSIPWLRQGVWLVSIMSLLGLFFVGRGQSPVRRRQHARFWVAGCALLALFCAVLSLNMPGPTSDPEAIKGFLSGFVGAQEIRTFSIPTEAWTYRIDGLNPGLAFGFLTALGALCFVTGDHPGWKQIPLLVQGITAVGLVAVVIWQGVQVAGFPWRDVDGALAVSTIVAVLGYWFYRSPGTSSCLAVLSTLPLLLAV